MNVTNAPKSGQPLTVATSSDLATVSLTEVLSNPLAVTDLAVSTNTSSSRARDAVTTISFKASANGAILNGFGTAVVTAPRGTLLPGVATTNVGGGVTTVLGNGNVAQVTLGTVAAGGSVTITMSGVVNGPAGTGTWTVTTSSDPTPATTTATVGPMTGRATRR